MKITKREQVLLGVLLLVLLGYSYYNFIYTKQIQKITELKVVRDTNLQKWEQVKAKIASKDKKNEQYITLNNKISKDTDGLFPSIEQEEIILILDKMIIDSNLKADLLGFSELSSENATVDTSKAPISEENSKIATNELDKLVSAFNDTSKKDDKSEKTNTSNAKSNVIGAYKMQVTLDFKGTYHELIRFIEEVEDYPKKIIINSINLIGLEGSDISGTLILEFYGVPKLNNNSSFKWDYTKPSGSGNPFFSTATSLQVNNEGNNNGVITNSEVKAENEITIKKAESEMKSDFVMTAKPFTSDVHTVTIAKAKDENKQSYIYSDNKKIELVEFYFTRVSGKYFYKYKTSVETYPDNFESYIEFVPNGENIMLDVFSQKRGLASDLSGVDVKIVNETEKGVVANILDDDKNKPRVKITGEKGQVSVIRSYDYYADK